jgi:hypothetical protein
MPPQESLSQRLTAGREVVAPGRVELPTFGLGNHCSIHLSYGATCTINNLKDVGPWLCRLFTYDALQGASHGRTRQDSHVYEQHGSWYLQTYQSENRDGKLVKAGSDAPGYIEARRHFSPEIQQHDLSSQGSQRILFAIQTLQPEAGLLVDLVAERQQFLRGLQKTLFGKLIKVVGSSFPPSTRSA